MSTDLQVVNWKAHFMASSSNPLPVVAKEIKVRFDKADKLVGEADDHRLANSILIADAEKRVRDGEAGNMPTGKPYTWPTWRQAFIKRSQQEISRLLKVGQSPDPKAAMKKLRAGNAAKKRDRVNYAEVGVKITKLIPQLSNTKDRDAIWDSCWSLFMTLNREDQEAFIDQVQREISKAA